VYYAPISVHGTPWSSYGACFDAILNELYEPVRGSSVKSLWQLRGTLQRTEAPLEGTGEAIGERSPTPR